jgi:tRNA (guanine37-N1)-methyltransferase
MQIEIFSLFPETMHPYLHASMMGKAQEAGHLQVLLHNIRDYTHDRHHTTDDEPYGGGGGMVMKPDPIFEAVEQVLGESRSQIPIILLTPQGRLFNHKIAEELSRHPRLALISGRYEGVDERVRQYLATDEISIGDYVLTGGELPAMVLIDTITRLLPGVLGDAHASEQDSHATGLLEHPHYTRPPVFREWSVPDVLLSGDHARIAHWRKAQSLLRTMERRPDLIESMHPEDPDIELVKKLEADQKPAEDEN